MWLCPLILAFAVTACGVEDPEGGSQSAEEETPTETQDEAAEDGPKWSEDDVEYKLAVIDEGGFVDHDDKRIDDYANALNRAERKCKEDRTKIADMAVFTVQQLDERVPGHEENTLTMIRAANDSLKSLKGKTPCSDIFATLVVLMTS